VLLLSELFTKKFGKKIFPEYYKSILKVDKRLKELKNLIRLTLIHNDKNTYAMLQEEYAELYNKIFFTKLISNSIFLIPLVIFAIAAFFYFIDKYLLLPPLNFILLIVGIYFLIKLLYSFFRNFSIRKK
ncbi:hypothetical protein ACFLSQ_05010, partial [Bacteroidota bacterium]